MENQRNPQFENINNALPSAEQINFNPPESWYDSPDIPDFTPGLDPEYVKMLEHYQPIIEQYAVPLGDDISSPVPSVKSETNPQGNGFVEEIDRLFSSPISNKNKLSVANPIAFSAKKTQFDRYYNHPNFARLGFHPYSNNEEYYNANSTVFADARRMLTQFANLVGSSVSSTYRSYGDLFGSDPYTTPDIKTSDEFESAMGIGMSTRGGVVGFTNNLFLNFGYTFGIIASVAVEEALLAGASALTGGGAAPVAGARTVTNIGRVGRAVGNSLMNSFGIGRLANATRQLTQNLNRADNARTFWQATRSGEWGVLGTLFLPETMAAVKKLQTAKTAGKSLSDIAKMSTLFGGFYREIRAINYAMSESKLESGSVFRQQLANGLAVEEMKQMQGLEPNLALVGENAQKAAFATTMMNFGLIYMSNKLVLDTAFAGFSRSLAREISDQLPALQRRIIQSKRTINPDGSVALDVFEDAGTGIRGTIKRVKAAGTRGAIDMAIGASLKYFAANLAEGVQEIGQEAISHGTKEYFTKLQDKPLNGGADLLRDTIGSALNSQMSAQGIETFLSGFLMGGLAKGPQKLIFEALPNVFAKITTGKDYNKLKTEAVAKLVEAQNELWNKIATDPNSVIFDLNKVNFLIQQETANGTKETSYNGDVYNFLDHKDLAKFQQVHTLMVNGTAHLFRQQLQDYLNLTDEELVQAFPTFKEEAKSGKLRERANDMIVGLDKAEAAYRKNKDLLVNPYDPNKYEKNTSEFYQEALKYQAFEHVRYLQMYTENSFNRALERANKIYTELASDPIMGKIQANDLTLLLDDKAIIEEIRLLNSEIQVLDDTEESEKLKTEKRTKIEKLKKLAEILGSEDNFKKDGSFDKRKIRRLLEPLKEYVQFLADSRNDFVDPSRIVEVLKKITDHRALGNRALLNNKSLRFLAVPENFDLIYQRQLAVTKQFFENNKKDYETRVKTYINKVEANQLLNELKELGVYPDAAEAERFLLTGDTSYLTKFLTEDGKVTKDSGPIYNQIQDLINTYNEVSKEEETEKTEEKNEEGGSKTKNKNITAKEEEETEDDEYKFTIDIERLDDNYHPTLLTALNANYSKHVKTRLKQGKTALTKEDWQATDDYKNLINSYKFIKTEWRKELESQARSKEDIEKDFLSDNGLREWLEKRETIEEPRMINNYRDTETSLMDFFPEAGVNMNLLANQQIKHEGNNYNVVVEAIVDDQGQFVNSYVIKNKNGSNLREEIDDELLKNNQGRFLDVETAIQVLNQLEEKYYNEDVSLEFQYGDFTLITGSFVFSKMFLFEKYKVISTSKEVRDTGELVLEDSISGERITVKSPEQFADKYQLDEFKPSPVSKNLTRLRIKDPVRHTPHINDGEDRKQAVRRIDYIFSNLTPEERKSLELVVIDNPNSGATLKEEFAFNEKEPNPQLRKTSDTYIIGIRISDPALRDRINNDLENKADLPISDSKDGIIAYIPNRNFAYFNSKGEQIDPRNMDLATARRMFYNYNQELTQADLDTLKQYFAIQASLISLVESKKTSSNAGSQIEDYIAQGKVPKGEKLSLIFYHSKNRNEGINPTINPITGTIEYLFDTVLSKDIFYVDREGNLYRAIAPTPGVYYQFKNIKTGEDVMLPPSEVVSIDLNEFNLPIENINTEKASYEDLKYYDLWINLIDNRIIELEKALKENEKEIIEKELSKGIENVNYLDFKGNVYKYFFNLKEKKEFTQRRQKAEIKNNQYEIEIAKLQNNSETQQQEGPLIITSEELANAGFSFNIDSRFFEKNLDAVSPRQLNITTVKGKQLIFDNRKFIFVDEEGNLIFERRKDYIVSELDIDELDFPQKIEQEIEELSADTHNRARNKGAYVLIVRHESGEYTLVELKPKKLDDTELEDFFDEIIERSEKTIQENLNIVEGQILEKAEIKEGGLPYNNDFNKSLQEEIYIVAKPNMYVRLTVSPRGRIELQVFRLNKENKFEALLVKDGVNSPASISYLEMSEAIEEYKKNGKDKLDVLTKLFNAKLFNDANTRLEEFDLNLSMDSVRRSFPKEATIDQVLDNTETNHSTDVRYEYQVTISQRASDVQAAREVSLIVEQASKKKQEEAKKEEERQEEKNKKEEEDKQKTGEDPGAIYIASAMLYLQNSAKYVVEEYNKRNKLIESIKARITEIQSKVNLSAEDKATIKRLQEEQKNVSAESEILKNLIYDINRVYSQINSIISDETTSNKEKLISVENIVSEEEDLFSEFEIKPESDENVETVEQPEVNEEVNEKTIAEQIAEKEKEIDQAIKSKRGKTEEEKIKIKKQIEVLKKELQDLKNSRANKIVKGTDLDQTDIQDIDDFLDWAAKNLPDYIDIQDINTLGDNMKSGGMRVGAFALALSDIAGGMRVKGTLYTGAKSPYRYHEAFHAVFRMLLTDEQQSKYLRLAAKEVRAKLRKDGISFEKALKEFSNLTERYKQLSRDELIKLYYEEYLADQFELFKQSPKSTKTDPINKSFFARLIEWIKSFFSRFTKNELTRLYENIDSGKFKTAIPVVNRFTLGVEQGVTIKANAIIPYRGKNKNTYSYLDPDVASSIVRSMASIFIERESINTDPNKTRSQLLDEIIEDFKNLYDPDKESYESISDESYLVLDNIADSFNDYSEFFKDEVTKYLGLVDLNIEDSIYLYEEQEDDEGLRTVSDWDKDASNYGGWNSISSMLRKFIMITSLEESDIFGNTELKPGENLVVPVDFAFVYNGLLKSTANETDPEKILKKIILFAQYNNHTRAVVNKILNRIGITEEQIIDGNWMNSIKDPFFYNALISGFENFRVDYLFVHRNVNGQYYIYTAALRDDANSQIDRWGQAHLPMYEKYTRDEDFKKKALEVINRFQALISTKFKDVSDEDLRKNVKDIRKDLIEYIGIELSEQYIAYLITRNISNRTDRQELLNSAYDNITALTDNNFVYMKQSITANKNMFSTDITGAGIAIKQMALANAEFDETVGASVFKNPNGDLVYAHQKSSFHLKMIELLNDENLLNDLKKDPFLTANWLLNNEAFFQLVREKGLSVTRVAGLKQGNIEQTDEGISESQSIGKTYGDLSPREFLAVLVNTYPALYNESTGKLKNTVQVKQDDGTYKRVALAPVLLRVLEASNTGDMVFLPVVETVKLDEKGNVVLTDKALDGFINNIKAEFERIKKNVNPNTRDQRDIENYNKGKKRAQVFGKNRSILTPKTNQSEVIDSENINVDDLSVLERVKYYKQFGIKKEDGTDITVKDVEENPTLYQKSPYINEALKESEFAIRDLAARLVDRIGGEVKFILDKDRDYSGFNKGNLSVINLAKATLDTPIHEIVGHPIIRAIKNKSYTINEVDTSIGIGIFRITNKKYEVVRNNKVVKTFNKKNEAEEYINSTNDSLYQNLLKELEKGYGKEVLDRIKKNYISKDVNFPVPTKDGNKVLSNVGDVDKGFYYLTNDNGDDLGNYSYEEIINNYPEIKDSISFSLEEQQEEALVQLLGELTAGKIKETKENKNLISFLKQLLKQMTDYMRSLFNSKEIEIDKLRADITLNDLANLLAYTNSKIILPGSRVEYTTPDGQKFNTYQEASNHISKLFSESEDVDLNNFTLDNSTQKGKLIEASFYFKNRFFRDFGDWYRRGKLSEDLSEIYLDILNNNGKLYETIENDSIKVAITDSGNYYHFVGSFPEKVTKEEFEDIIKYRRYDFFINRNKKYEQGLEIINAWKKENNIIYNPEEVYSRGQGFYHAIGAYANLELDLLLQNLLQHIEDNKKAGGKFVLSAYTKPINKRIKHLEGKSSIRIVMYPKSEDILWAARRDVYSGSVWDSAKAVSENKKSELLGVTFTKAPSEGNVDEVTPNLASIIDERTYQHNELGIELTSSNFRIEYDNNVPIKLKKLVDSINSILDERYGKIIKPEININQEKTYKNYYEETDSEYTITYVKQENDYKVTWYEDKYKDSESIIKEEIIALDEAVQFKPELLQLGIEPTQTDKNTKSISKFRDEFFYRYNRELNRYSVRYDYSSSSFGIYDSSTRKYTSEKRFKTEKEAEKFFRANYKIEYKKQLLINSKVARLKEVAKKYPRSLISSDVINDTQSDIIQYQQSKLTPKQQLQQKLNELRKAQKQNSNQQSQAQNSNQIYDLLGEKTESNNVVIKDAEGRGRGKVNLPTKDVKINIYAGDNENSKLSNFAIRPFTINVDTPSGNKEFTFQSVEQGFHFYKTIVANNAKVAAKILKTTDGGALRRLTNRKNLPMTDKQVKEWDDTSKSIMLNLMYESYAQNPDEAQRLLNTGEATITHTQDNTRWKTDFPEVVMTVRDMLREEGFDKNQSSNSIIAYRTRKDNFLEALREDNAIGNPFSHKGYSMYKSYPATVEQAVKDFISWMIGESHTDKLQDYRQAIIDKIINGKLQGKTIYYYEELNQPSHATALDYLINNYDWNRAEAQQTEEYVSFEDYAGIDQDVEDTQETEMAADPKMLRDWATEIETIITENNDLSFEEVIEQLGGMEEFKAFLINRLEQEYKDFRNTSRNVLANNLYGNNIKAGLKNSDGVKTANVIESMSLLNMTDDFDYNLKQIFFNNWLNTAAINQILLGDRALILKNSTDEIKRAKGANASGDTAATNAIAEEYGIMHETAHISMFGFTDPKNSKSYGTGADVEIADGQSYMTIKAFKHFWFGLGKLTPKHGRLLQRIERGEEIPYEELLQSAEDGESYAKAQAMLNSKKFVYYDGKIYLKTSIFILTKEYTSYYEDGMWKPKPNKRALHNLRESMERFENDEWAEGRGTLALAAPESALKEFKMNIQNFNDATSGRKFTSDNRMDMDANYLKLQTINPSNKMEITDPGQIRTLITAEQDLKTKVYINGKTFTIEQIKAYYNEALKNRDKLNYTNKRNLIFRFDIDKATELLDKSIKANTLLPELYTFLMYAAAGLKSSNATSNIQEMFSVDENGQQKYNLNNPQTIRKFEQLFLSFFAKGVLNAKIPGTSAALVSDMGVRVYRIVYSVDKKTGMPDLQDVIREDEFHRRFDANAIEYNIDNGPIAGDDKNLSGLAEAVKKGPVIIIDRLRDNMKEYVEVEKDKYKYTGQRYSEMIMAPHEINMAKEFVGNNELMPDFLSKIFGVRIPSQDKHSFLNVKWVDFMPGYYGSSAVFPRELVEKSGADFDIDKLYMHMKEYFFENGQFYEYGKAKTEKEKFKHYVKSLNKNVKKKGSSIALAFEKYESNPVLGFDIEKVFDDVKEYGISVESIKAAAKLGLPYTFKDYQEYKRKNGNVEPYVEALNNEILDYKYALLGNEHITNTKGRDVAIHNEPADTSPLDKLLEELKDDIPEIAAMINEDDVDIDNMLNAMKAFDANKAGADSIGAAVLPNLYLSLLKEYNISIPEIKDKNGKVISTNLNLNNRNYNDFFGDYAGTYRKQYIISALITAMTDNAKLRLSKKLGLNKDALAVVTNMTALGVPIKTSIMLVNNPIIQELYFQAINKENPLDPGMRFLASQMLASLIEKYESFTEVEEPTLKMKVTDEILFKAWKDKIDIRTAFQSNDPKVVKIAYNILDVFMTAYSIKEYTGKLGSIISLNKGPGKTYLDILRKEKDINDLGLHLSDARYKNYYQNALDSGQIIIDVRPIFKDTWQGNLLNIFIEIKDKLLPRVFITRTGPYVKMLDKIYANTINLNQEDREKIRLDLLSYLTIKAYDYSLQTSGSKDIASLNNNLLYPQLEGEKITTVVDRMRQKYPNNFFLRYFAISTKAEAESNKLGIDTITANTFNRLSDSAKLKLQSALVDLSSKTDVYDDFRTLIHYIMVKDGMGYAYGSLLESVTPFLYERYLNIIDGVENTLLNFQENNVLTTFGVGSEDLINDFLKGYLQNTKLRYKLKKLKGAGFRNKSTFENTDIVDQFNLNEIENETETLYLYGENENVFNNYENTFQLKYKKEDGSFYTNSELKEFREFFAKSISDFKDKFLEGDYSRLVHRSKLIPDYNELASQQPDIAKHIKLKLEELGLAPISLAGSKYFYTTKENGTTKLIIDMYPYVESGILETDPFKSKRDGLVLNDEELIEKVKRFKKTSLAKNNMTLTTVRDENGKVLEVIIPFAIRLGSDETGYTYYILNKYKTSSTFNSFEKVNISANYAEYIQFSPKGSIGQWSGGFMHQGELPSNLEVREYKRFLTNKKPQFKSDPVDPSKIEKVTDQKVTVKKTENKPKQTGPKPDPTKINETTPSDIVDNDFWFSLVSAKSKDDDRRKITAFWNKLTSDEKNTLRKNRNQNTNDDTIKSILNEYEKGTSTVKDFIDNINKCFI